MYILGNMLLIAVSVDVAAAINIAIVNSAVADGRAGVRFFKHMSTLHGMQMRILMALSIIAVHSFML